MKKVEITDLVRGRSKWFATTDSKYSLWYDHEREEYSCTCLFSSWFRYSPRFRNVVCRHFKALLLEVENAKK